MEPLWALLKPADYVTAQWPGGAATQPAAAPAAAAFAARFLANRWDE